MRVFAASSLVLFALVLASGCGSAGGNPLDGASGTPSGAGGTSAKGGSSTGNPFAGQSSSQGGASSTGTGGAGGGLDLGGGGGMTGCASESYGGELVPLDMFILLDRSGSMSDNNKWQNITGAINQFCQLPSAAGIGVGLQFFPWPQDSNPPAFCGSDADCGQYAPCMPTVPGAPGICAGGPECNYQEYNKAVVEIAPLPGNAAAIQSAIASTGPNGGTPTTPALQGVLNYTYAWAQAHPDHTCLVVLATDGEPTGCDSNDIASASAFAAMGVTATPQLKTFVIGVGDSLSNLNAIAMAGGTDQALIVDATADAAKQFADALDKIRGSVACDFKIPPPSSGQVDYGLVNVDYTPAGGTPTTLYQVANQAACGVNGGWYYDDPNHPQKIVLCDATCAGVKQGAMTSMGGEVDIVLGCKTQQAH